MTIPLETYDPDWEKRHDATKAQIEINQAAPATEARGARYARLVDQLHRDFHAQFKTTGDFAEWVETNARESVAMHSYLNLEFDIPKFPRDNSVEQTNVLYTVLMRRMEREAEMIRNAKPVSYPAPGLPFAANLSPLDKREIIEVARPFDMPDMDDPSLPTRRTATYTAIIERTPLTANICIIQTSELIPTPVNNIAELATEIYKKQFSMGAMNGLHKYYPPDRTEFSIYIPPRVTGREILFFVDMDWSGKLARFENPEFDREAAVPYFLRKLAFKEGLALDPDVPVRPQPRSANRTPPSNDNG
jgi:hypothetical protein